MEIFIRLKNEGEVISLKLDDFYYINIQEISRIKFF